MTYYNGIDIIQGIAFRSGSYIWLASLLGLHSVRHLYI